MIIYQVYPRSFSDSNNDGIGDLAGIAENLGYIKKLGVDAIWISPFFKSPMKDFGYDVADYRAVDPIFGSMDDFKHLLAKARSLKLGVIIDMVISHTSEEHAWFQQSRLRNDNKADWYLWADAKPDGSPPNNWVSVFGGGAWRWDAQRRQYYFHSFLSSQPDLNMHNEEVQAQVLSDMRFWLDLGVSGFRFDACNHLFQDKLLRNNPAKADVSAALHPYGFQLHVHDQAQPEVLAFLERTRELLDEYDAFSLAEVGGHDALQLMGQYTEPGRLHSAYSFALMTPDSSAAHVRKVIQTLEQSISSPGGPCYALSNHDKPRVASRWAKGRDHQHTAKQMLALLIAMRGDICLYQGEELGLPQADVSFERLQDPFGKVFWPNFKGRDGCRTPMPWSSHRHGGFSDVEPWLPVAEEHLSMNVASQEAQPDSILNFAKRVLALRKARPELSKGTIELLDAPEGLLAFSRTFEERQMICLFNMELDKQRFEIPPHSEIVIAQNATINGTAVVIDVSGFCLVETSPRRLNV